MGCKMTHDVSSNMNCGGKHLVGLTQGTIESAGGVVTSGYHIRLPRQWHGFNPRYWQLRYKNLALNIGDCVSLVNQRITLMSVPSQFGT